jgi:hypothetical protein
VFKEILWDFGVVCLNVPGFEVRCGLAMLHKLAGVNPAQVIASHEPGIEPCRHSGNDMLDA